MERERNLRKQIIAIARLSKIKTVEERRTKTPENLAVEKIRGA